MSRELEAAVARQVDAVRAFDPSQTPVVENAARLVPGLVVDLGLGAFMGAVVCDAKPRLLLRFRTDPAGPLRYTGRDVVLKVYGDQPRGEGPLLSLWRERGINIPRLRFGERGGGSWLALEYLLLSKLQPQGRAAVLALTREVASQAKQMHALTPQLDHLLRPLSAVMLPRWDAAVAALCSSGHAVPGMWRSRAAAAYRHPHPTPLHGDLALTNIARDPHHELVVYDASALRGPRFFDGARWAARVAQVSTPPEEVLGCWTLLEPPGRGDHVEQLLATECVLEAGSLETVRARIRATSDEETAHLHAHATWLMAAAERLFATASRPASPSPRP